MARRGRVPGPGARDHPGLARAGPRRAASVRGGSGGADRPAPAREGLRRHPVAVLAAPPGRRTAASRPRGCRQPGTVRPRAAARGLAIHAGAQSGRAAAAAVVRRSPRQPGFGATGQSAAAGVLPPLQRAHVARAGRVPPVRRRIERAAVDLDAVPPVALCPALPRATACWVSC